MKKSIIALAVAGAFATPAFAATSNVDVYGLLHFAIQDTDVTGSDIEISDRVSRIGFKGSEDLGGGLKALWQIEQQIDATADSCTGDSTVGTCYGYASKYNSTGAFGGAGLRNTFVGLSGGFGTVVMGRHDTPYKMATGSLDLFADTIADYNKGLDGVNLIDGAHDHRSPQALAYISPEFSGFQVAGAAIMTNTSGNLDNGDDVDAYSLSATYKNGPLFVGAAYQDVEVIDSTAWKIAATYAFGDLTVGALYEDVENYLSSNAVPSGRDRDSWLVEATYAMGPIKLKGMYGQADVNGADQDAWTLGVDYSMSKRTTAYALFSTGDNDVNDDVSGWAIGVKHSF